MSLSKEDALMLFVASDNVSAKIRRTKSVQVHNINKMRSVYGEYKHLFPQLVEDEKKFVEYFRMTKSTFDYILEKLENRLIKNWQNYHKKKILPEERLVVTLRYLSTGLSFRGLAFSFRMGKSTVAQIVEETTRAIWEELQPIHMQVPTEDGFKNISEDFYNIWNFPHAIGCLDGKHVRIDCPINSGSMYLNYKHFFSIVLQGLVDANYKFVTVDVGCYGKQSDGGIFGASDLFQFIQSGEIKFPEPDSLPRTNMKAPYVILADEAYPLLPNLMKPYERKGLNKQKINFNRRLSRARNTVECAFGILYSKWRLLSKSVETKVELAEVIVKSVCVLHNTIIDIEGIDRHLTDVTVQGKSVQWERAGRQLTDAKDVRDVFALYMEKYPLRYQ